MSKVEIKANKREESRKKNKFLRREGLLPAVIYGRKFKSTPISINLKEFIKKVEKSEAGHNLLFTLKIDKESVPVITHDIDRNSLTDEILHLDFMHVVMDEVIKTSIPVELIGQSIGVKDSGGILVHGLHELEIECLPGDIPNKIEVDVTLLDIGQTIVASELKISKSIQLISGESEMIATVSAPTKEEEPAVLAPPLEGAEGEVPVDGEAPPAEGAEGAEGAAKPAPGAPSEKAPAEADKNKK